MYSKMFLISEDEYNNLRAPTMMTAPFYTAPDRKAEERDFKHLGEALESKAKQLFSSILKYSRVNDRNEWFEKRDDPLPISGTNIVDMITYAIKKPGVRDPIPNGWNSFVEFLKKNKAVPRSLLRKAVQDMLTEPKVHVQPVAAAAPVVAEMNEDEDIAGEVLQGDPPPPEVIGPVPFEEEEELVPIVQTTVAKPVVQKSLAQKLKRSVLQKKTARLEKKIEKKVTDRRTRRVLGDKTNQGGTGLKIYFK